MCGTLATSDCAGHCAHLLQIRSFSGEKQRSIHGLRKRVCGRHSSNRYIRIRASAECVGTPIVTGRSNQKFIDDFTRRPENTGKGREKNGWIQAAAARMIANPIWIHSEVRIRYWPDAAVFAPV